MARIHDQVLPEGTQIGVYEIKDVLKIDFFSITYRAWNHHMKAQVILKEYYPHDFSMRDDNKLSVKPKSSKKSTNFEYGLKIFMDQAELLIQIEHPNIVATENILPFNGTAYQIINFQKGMPLSELEASSTLLSDVELKFILTSILSTLETVHENKVVHGAIRPEAIILEENGEPILADFSTARLAIAAHTDKLKNELEAGYAPAEQYVSTNESGPATDFYALGATMYYCITRIQPVAAQDRIDAINKGDADPLVSFLDSLSTTYSEDLLEAIRWMLCLKYADRPKTATEVLAILNSESSHRVKSANSEQPSVDVSEDGLATNQSHWIGIAMGLVALIAAGLWFQQSGKETAEPLLNDKPAAIATAPASSSTVPPVIEMAESTDPGVHVDQIVTLATVDVDEEANSSSADVPLSPEVESLAPEKQAMQIDEDTSQNVPLYEERLSEDLAMEVEDSFIQENIVAAVSEENQAQVGVDAPVLPAPNNDSVKTVVYNESVKRYLRAAEAAMRAMQFTTPVGNNAYDYYQMALVEQADNAEAIAGLKKIVGKYVQLIEEAQADGQLQTARVYLRRAEAVIPNAPELRRVREELAASD